MRISDWSSDVCSSDLPAGEGAESPLNNAQAEQTANLYICIRLYIRALWRVVLSLQFRTGLSSSDGSAWNRPRSEEHTSELQSLMRISYAVFCLTKISIH